KEIPILSKDIIRNNLDSLVNLNYRKLNEVVKNTSGGSTGEPVTFFGTKEQDPHGYANYYLSLHQNGVNFYNSSVDLWGAERDMYNVTSKFNIGGFINNKTTLNTFVLSEEIIKTYITRLNRIK